jgi:hypothetical protein
MQHVGMKSITRATAWSGALLLAAGACGLCDLLAPGAGPLGDGALSQDAVAALTIMPSDTTLLAGAGSRVCYRWSARNQLGHPVPGVVPEFTLTTNPGGRLEQSAQEPHCFEVTVPGSANATVQAAVGAVIASAKIRVRP